MNRMKDKIVRRVFIGQHLTTHVFHEIQNKSSPLRDPSSLLHVHLPSSSGATSETQFFFSTVHINLAIKQFSEIVYV